MNWEDRPKDYNPDDHPRVEHLEVVDDFTPAPDWVREPPDELAFQHSGAPFFMAIRAQPDGNVVMWMNSSDPTLVGMVMEGVAESLVQAFRNQP